MLLLDFKNSDAGDLNDKDRYVTPTELADIYCQFIKDYPIVSIEDPFDQDDWEGNDSLRVVLPVLKNNNLRIRPFH